MLLPVLVRAQTIGLISHDTGTYDNGFVLFAPIMNTTTYLVDKCGKEVHSWTSAYHPGQSVYLLPDGTLLRPGSVGNTTFTAGGNGGIIEQLDWNSTVLWSYTLSDTAQCQHHDVVRLPNGHILAIVWELKSAADAIAMGRNPTLTGTTLWSEKIVELQPTGSNSATIVWEWHVWDHLVQDYDNTRPNYLPVSANPGLLNINFAATTQADWLHFNAIDYNPALDQVMISCHNFNEIWIIDHSTTTAQAAGHTGGNSGKGGDLLYRWGNPQAYNNGTAADEKLWGQHNAHWLPAGVPDAGKIMIFNNSHGLPAATNYSSIEIVDPPVSTSGVYTATLPYLPSSSYWTYTAATPTSFYAQNISGAQQLPNGNVLICNGPAGDFFEVTGTGTKVWEYINPVKATGPMSQGTTPTQNLAFRCTQYYDTFSGFAGHTLAPGDPIELNPLTYSCDLVTGIRTVNQQTLLKLSPIPASDRLSISISIVPTTMLVVNTLGQVVATKDNMTKTAAGYELSLQGLPQGIYALQVTTATDKRVEKFVVVK